MRATNLELDKKKKKKKKKTPKQIQNETHRVPGP